MKHQAVVIAFLAGVVAGAGAARYFAQRQDFRWKSDPERIVSRLDKKLGFDPKQREAVRAAVMARQEKVKALHGRVKADFSEMRLAMRADIDKVLNPEQKAKFVEMNARWDEKRRKLEEAK